MSKTNFYKLIIGCLVLSNLMLLYFYYQNTIPYKGPKKIIKEKLHFDDAQISQYDAIILKHRKAIVENEKKIRVLKNSLYQQLLLNSNSKQVNQYTYQIGVLQQNSELIDYEHFQELKKICKPNQEVYFKNLVKELVYLFQPPK